MPTGFVTLTKATHRDGTVIRGRDAIDALSIKPAWREAKSYSINLADGEVPLGSNMFLDNGRQILAYLFGGRSPMGSYACQLFGVGTGTTPPSVVDTALASPVAFPSTSLTKALDAVSFPSPFVARAEFTIGANECNGYLLTEIGLFSGNGVLLARVVNAGISKTSEWSPALTWCLRL